MIRADSMGAADVANLIRVQSRRIARRHSQRVVGWHHIALAALDPICWDDGVAAVVETLDVDAAALRDELAAVASAQTPFLDAVPALERGTAGDYLCAAAHYDIGVRSVLVAHGFRDVVARAAISAQVLRRQSCTHAARKCIVAAFRTAHANGHSVVEARHVWHALTSPEFAGTSAHLVLDILNLDVAQLHRVLDEWIRADRGHAGVTTWDSALRREFDAALGRTLTEGHPIDTARLLQASTPTDTAKGGLGRLLFNLAASPSLIESANRTVRRGAVAPFDRSVPTERLGSRAAFEIPVPVVSEVTWLIPPSIGQLSRALIFRSDGTPLVEGYAARLIQGLWLWMVAVGISSVYFLHEALWNNWWPVLSFVSVVYRPSWVGFRVWLPLTLVACMVAPWPLSVVCVLNGIVVCASFWFELQIRRNDSGNPNVRIGHVVEDAQSLMRMLVGKRILASGRGRRLFDG
ncbi:hypothetical protein [Antrihabitans spumae]|uniref:Clp R domain-containing protein n=1 Tax=Antrihabitans spumae TaxID=3373370 RepID=A0ABW7KNB4_9NOCA